METNLMTTYIISYDLHKDRDYSEFFESLRSYDSWAQITSSTWMVKSPYLANDVYEYLYNFIDSNDPLFVVKSGSESAWSSILTDDDYLASQI